MSSIISIKTSSEIVLHHGGDIFFSDEMIEEKAFKQHGRFSVYQHSFGVACMSVYLARRLGVDVDMRSLVRGALLHDYFLYDWHKPENAGLKHAFGHAGFAHANATRDFDLNEIEQDIIIKHMFPMNLRLPNYRESVLVCVADKICALCETFYVDIIKSPYTAKVGER